MLDVANLSFWCALCPHGFSGFFFLLFIAKWNISAIHKVKQFRLMYNYWLVLPSHFLKGTNLLKTLRTLMIDNAYWVSPLLFGSCAQRHKSPALGNWTIPVCHPILRIENSLKSSIVAFLVLSKFYWHQWSYLQNKEYLTGVSVLNNFC